MRRRTAERERIVVGAPARRRTVLSRGSVGAVAQPQRSLVSQTEEMAELVNSRVLGIYSQQEAWTACMYMA
jgi:hypothetical protein